MTLDQIRTKTYFLTSTSSGSWSDAALVAEANTALDRIVSLIIQSDGRWQWDDSNNTDLPIATTGLVTDQQDYTLSTGHLEILRVEIQDSTANWHKLIPIDQVDIHDTSLTDYLKTSGLPMFYDKLGNSLFLYPKPNYTQAASLKVYYQRGPSYFATSDTGKIPGFNVLYHDLIPLWIAYNYALANGKSYSQALMAEIQMREDTLREDYALRAKDDHNGLRARIYSWP